MTTRADEPAGSPPGRRSVWESRWQEGTDASFAWHMTEVPEDLPDLLDHTDLPVGAVLDLGCGGGVATAYLAGRAQPTIGLDIAYAAVTQARSLANQSGVRAHFVVADATALPFRPQSFRFIFDRGCLQNLPQAAWSGYFPGIDTLLVPAGMLQLYCSKASDGPAPLWSRSGLRTRLARLRGKRGPGPQFLSRPLIEQLVPSSLAVLALEDRDFRTTKGNLRALVYGVFEKVPAARGTG